MSATLIFKRGLGVLHADSNTLSPGSPNLKGTINFTLNEEDDVPVLCLKGAAWIKTRDLKRYYALSFSGLEGALFPVGEKLTDDGPDYVGTLGPNQELVVFGWKYMRRRGVWCISLEIFDRERPTTVLNGETLANDCIG